MYSELLSFYQTPHTEMLWSLIIDILMIFGDIIGQQHSDKQQHTMYIPLEHQEVF